MKELNKKSMVLKFKKGDFVICKPGFDSTDNPGSGGGSGYESGRIFKVYKISDGNSRYILWPSNSTDDNSENCGIFNYAVESYDNIDLVEQIILKEIYG